MKPRDRMSIVELKNSVIVENALLREALWSIIKARDITDAQKIARLILEKVKL